MFLLDPDDPGETEKPGEVIRGSGGRKSPAGSRGRAPGGEVRGGAKPPKRGSRGGVPRS